MSWQAPHTAVTVSFPGPSGNSCAKAGGVAAPSAAAMRDNAVFIKVSSPKNGPCVETKDGECSLSPRIRDGKAVGFTGLGSATAAEQDIYAGSRSSSQYVSNCETAKF